MGLGSFRIREVRGSERGSLNDWPRMDADGYELKSSADLRIRPRRGAAEEGGHVFSGLRAEMACEPVPAMSQN